MAKVDTLWTCVGITKLRNRAGKELVKIRFGVDMIRRVKSVQGFIKSVDGADGTRVDFISLPEPMNKMAALEYARQAPEFQSPEDQALIDEQIHIRTPKAASKSTKTKAVKASKKAAPSLMSIRARKNSVSVADVLTAVAEVSEQE